LIAEIALRGGTLEEAKIGIIAGSLAATLLAFAVFGVLGRIPEETLRRGGLVPAAPLTDLAVPVDPAREHVLGPADAAVTLLEYGDYECPYCREAESVVRRLLADFEEDLRFVWRHLPLTDVHPNAQLAAEAAEAAAAQGAFWPLHARLLALDDPLLLVHLRGLAEASGLDVERFVDDLRARRHAPRVAEDVDSADGSGVSATPTFFVNGRRHDGDYDYETLAGVLREALALERARRAATGGP
jgi:protein-disulfide isomerase